MTIGWAGNMKDEIKGHYDILLPACEGRFHFLVTSGKIPFRRMNRFYNRLDVIAVASKHEGEPLILLEAMAAGCFPVCTDVGIVPELIRNGQNGLIVEERSARAFRDAFSWCESNLDHVREAGIQNAAFIRRERCWSRMILFFEKVFSDRLRFVHRSRFRNDDVSWDTNLELFRRFCAIFRKYGLVQVHGITLRGRTSTVFSCGGEPCEYEGVENISRASNDRIRTLSSPYPMEDRSDLVDFLNDSPDEVALHGLYHADHGTMTEEDQRREIGAGLEKMRGLFHKKKIKFFIPPFNRFNIATLAVCKSLGLEVLATEGCHLEANLDSLVMEPDTWYRYHHHRFYPESTFTHYALSLDKLDSALGSNFTLQPRDFRLDFL